MEQMLLLKLLNKEDSLDTIQNYIHQVIQMRGFSEQPVEKELLLLTEEVGELAKSIRKENAHMGIDLHKIQNYDSIESEVADVFIVLMSICNTLEINLFGALVAKEMINVNRSWIPIKK